MGKNYFAYLYFLSCVFDLKAAFEITPPEHFYTPIAILQVKVAQTYGQALYQYRSRTGKKNIELYGFARFTGYPDSRQIIRTQPGNVLLFSAPYLPDSCCKDINAHPQLSMQATGSKVGLLFGPDKPFCDSDIKLYGIIETDFRGINEDSNYLLRLRHAFGEIVWKDGSFLFGQYFHPLYILRSFPNTVDFNFGAPFEPQADSPQLRFTQFWDPFEFRIVLASQSYYLSNGPIGPSNTYLRNSAIPNTHVQLRWYHNEDFYGVALDYKRLIPRLVTYKNVKAHEHIDSIISEAYMHTTVSNFTLNGKIVYAQNGTDQLLISGYGVETINPITDERTYANTQALAVWFDPFYIFHDQQMLVGLFMGYTKNLGSRKTLFINPVTHEPIIYALACAAQNLDYTARIAPRFVYSNNALRTGIELEWSPAAFGKTNQFGKVINTTPVQNFRFTASFDYIF